MAASDSSAPVPMGQHLREGTFPRKRRHAEAANRGRTAAAVFLPGLAGMLAGLLIDTRAVHPDALIAMCTRADVFAARWARDWTFMPVTHVAMVTAAVLAVWIVEYRQARVRPSWMRVCTHGACFIAMTIGMTVGGQFALPLSAVLGSGFAGLFAAMTGGMIGGMALTAPLYRWA